MKQAKNAQNFRMHKIHSPNIKFKTPMEAKLDKQNQRKAISIKCRKSIKPHQKFHKFTQTL